MRNLNIPTVGICAAGLIFRRYSNVDKIISVIPEPENTTADSDFYNDRIGEEAGI